MCAILVLGRSSQQRLHAPRAVRSHCPQQPVLHVVMPGLEVARGTPHRKEAGALLETPEGFPLGTVCLLDYKPRELDETQKDFLRLMAHQVMKLLELRRIIAAEHLARLQAEEMARENQTLMRVGDHRLMNSLQLVQSILALQSRSSSSDETKAQLDMAGNRVLAIAAIHKQLHLTGRLEEVEIDAFPRRLCESLKQTAPSQITAINVTAENARLRSDLTSGTRRRELRGNLKRDGNWKSQTRGVDYRRALISIRARTSECRS
jgi:hypothetical protein